MIRYLLLLALAACARTPTSRPGGTMCLANLLDEAQQVRIITAKAKLKKCTKLADVAVKHCRKSKSSSPNYHTNILRNQTFQQKGNILFVASPLRPDAHGLIHGEAYRCKVSQKVPADL